MNQHRRKPSTPLRVHFHSTFGLLPIYFRSTSSLYLRSTSGLLPVQTSGLYFWYTFGSLLVYFLSNAVNQSTSSPFPGCRFTSSLRSASQFPSFHINGFICNEESTSAGHLYPAIFILEFNFQSSLWQVFLQLLQEKSFLMKHSEPKKNPIRAKLIKNITSKICCSTQTEQEKYWLVLKQAARP